MSTIIPYCQYKIKCHDDICLGVWVIPCCDCCIQRVACHECFVYIKPMTYKSTEDILLDKQYISNKCCSICNRQKQIDICLM